MTREVLTVSVWQRLSEVRKILSEHPIHHVPVVDGERLVGLLSSTDMVRLGFNAFGNNIVEVDARLDSDFSISEVMTTKLTTLDAMSTIREAAEVLSDGNFHSLPIVSGTGDLLGIVTSTDIIRYHLAQY
jgi:CBS domain-containing protein